MDTRKVVTRYLCLAIAICELFCVPRASIAQSMPTTNLLPLPAPAILRMHAGGASSGLWSAETGVTNGSNSSVVSTTNTINTTLDPFPAPQAVYQTARSGNSFKYVISSLTPGAIYPVKLHFAEFQMTAAGQREFNVEINGTQVLSNFDIFAVAGGEFMAVERAFMTTASAKGTITLHFNSGAQGAAFVNGIEILPPLNSSPTLNTGVYTITSQASRLNLDNDNVTSPGTNLIQYTPVPGNTNQQWQISELPDGTYDLLCLSDGLALDTNNLQTAGSPVVQFTTAPASPTANQHWRITPQSSGYTISAVANGLFLDSGSTASNGSLVNQNTATRSTSQIWNISPVQTGAVTPFVTYEGEWGLLQNGATVVSQLVPQPTEFVTEAIEASGRAYAHLVGTASSVQWRNLTGKTITAVNIRYAIPDAPNGRGIDATLNLYVNGQLRQAVPMNSHQTWTYETDATYFGSTETPGAGESAFEFWDEVHVPISGNAVQPNDSIALRIDTENTAAFYDIDCIDLEDPPAPLSQPPNSLSITSFGAIPNDSNSDSTTAIQNTINAAANQGASVWIPQGEFYLSSQLTVNGVTVQGAGMWYSTLYWNVLGTYKGNNLITGAGGTFENFEMDSNGNRETHKYGLNLSGTDWVINGVWLHHAGPSIWVRGTGGLAENNRINNSFADGINLNNGNGSPNTNSGNNLTAFNNFVRGTGDDGIAVNDAVSNPANPKASFVQMQNPVVIQNTVVAPWWADCYGIYGGVNIYVANNVASGGARQNGINTGPFFPIGGKFQGGQIQGNIVFQSGGKHRGAVPQPAVVAGVGNNWRYDNTQVTGEILRGNSVVNATFDALQVIAMQNGEFDNTIINSPAMNGIKVEPKSQGNAVFNNNDVFNIMSSFMPFIDSASAAFSATGSGNIGFTPN